ncbi:MAG TPA: FAD-dependent tricarballylate dehydrogenase TcuA [Thermodesulfobacteriota bacterium]
MSGRASKGKAYDVVVVGAGNAALAAAVSAKENGAARVLVLEKAPRETRGGNTHFSGGLLRFAYDSVEQILEVCPSAAKLEGFLEGIETYPASAFREDLMRVTNGRTDPELSAILIGQSYPTIRWMAGLGIEMEPAVSLGGVKVDGKIKWPKGAVIRAVHEGVGLSRSWFAIAESKGIEIRYDSRASRLVQDEAGRICGIEVQGLSGRETIPTRAVVLGCGGFEANQAWRAQYLGRPWDHAKVRGTRHNQGDGLRMALEIGAMPIGQWSGCHATPINAESPPYGVLELTDKTNRLSYPYGVMLNKEGRRFVDEAEDFQFFTYAKFGGIILNQPESVAYQIFDQKVVHLLEGRYSTSEPIVADTLDGLLEKLPIDRATARRTLEEYNAAAGHGTFNPGILDGMCTKGITPPKSNWAQRLDTPPFVCYPVTGGITFSFGGLKIDDQARVLDTGWRPITGLFACGEMVGNIFHYNYPGGTGLMSGAVFGRIAGASAARLARS